MKIKFLLLGTSLSLIPTLTNAQCVATTDCATLGYTETSCPDGKGLKCPFGTTYACPETDQSVCKKYGFKYDCKGTGYTSGIGQTCNNKYTSCTCSSGYEWKSGKCEKINTPSKGTLGTCTGYAKNCSIGQILNSDGTCTSDKVSGKTPIGIVVYIGSDGCGQAIALDNVYKSVSSSQVKSCDFNGGSSISDQVCQIFKDYYFSAAKNHDEALNDFDSCGNTKKLNEINNKIDEAGNQGYYPDGYFSIARAASQYAPSNAQNTKGKWCLPAAGIGREIYENYEKFNNIIKKVNGQLFYKSPSFYFSSTLGKRINNEDSTQAIGTPSSNIYHWGWFYDAGVLYPLGYFRYDDYYLGLDRSILIRPVIEF
ncbi:MAG: hypothetical protein Q4F75_02605 [Pseudomonadota bacterium]|nr:hypothetical protein [Pseudomonadota bacterium]